MTTESQDLGLTSHPKDGLILCCLICFFFTVKVMVAANFHFINHQGPRFQLKFFIIFLLTKKKKVTYILGGLRVDKWTANFHMWVTYLLKICPLNKNLRNQNGLSMTSLWKPFIGTFFFYSVFYSLHGILKLKLFAYLQYKWQCHLHILALI